MYRLLTCIICCIVTELHSERLLQIIYYIIIISNLGHSIIEKMYLFRKIFDVGFGMVFKI